MKKALTLCFLLITIVSCSSDDNSENDDIQASIIGAWKFTSSSTNGITDSIDICDLLNTIVISSNQIDITEYWGTDCTETDNYSIGYTFGGMSITITEGGESYTLEVLTLNETTLSTKEIDEGDVYIETYTRQ